jgi:hypothetical protein
MAFSPEFEEQLIDAQDAFVWEAPEYDRYDRGRWWYIVMCVVAVALVGYAAWTGNFLFAFIVLLAAIILVVTGNEKPKRVLAQIGHNGIVWRGEFLPFDDIHEFAVLYEPPHVRILYIEPKSVLTPRMRIYLGDQDPVAIRNHLRQYIKEDLELRDEHLSDLVSKILKI